MLLVALDFLVIVMGIHLLCWFTKFSKILEFDAGTDILRYIILFSTKIELLYTNLIKDYEIFHKLFYLHPFWVTFPAIKILEIDTGHGYMSLFLVP